MKNNSCQKRDDETATTTKARAKQLDVFISEDQDNECPSHHEHDLADVCAMTDDSMFQPFPFQAKPRNSL
jgi:hypothetical protein